MPVIKSAKKKLRQDKKRTERNQKVEDFLKLMVKKARKNPVEKTIRDAVSAADKAAKKHIIHKNKAARIKSALSKLLGKKAVSKETAPAAAKPVKSTKKTTKKKASKKTFKKS
ncbi:30S ribosomal protein S20 [Candidatus Microgenomates bacterium]|nr:MAG: 30S ribosomal protein S20 [Candidatus Microgenomates bacterium]